METKKPREAIPFASQEAFEAWLEANCESRPEGIDLRFYKKASGLPTLTYNEAVDAALCFGWIDGQKNKYDDISYVLHFVPRRPRSVWSKVNTLKVEKLTAEGKMRPNGLAQVEAAKADGRWDKAYEPGSTAEMPEDVMAALEANPKAKAFFDTLNKTNRYSIYFQVTAAKRPETRARRIAEFVAMCERQEKAR